MGLDNQSGHTALAARRAFFRPFGTGMQGSRPLLHSPSARLLLKKIPR